MLSHIQSLLQYLIIGAAFIGCSGWLDEPDPSDFHPEVIYEFSDEFSFSNGIDNYFEGNILLVNRGLWWGDDGFIKNYFMKVNLETYKVIWKNNQFKYDSTNPVIWNNFAIFSAYKTNEGEGGFNFAFLDLETGETRARFVLSRELTEEYHGIHGFWLKVIEDDLYFASRANDPEGYHVKFNRLNLKTLSMERENIQSITPEVLYTYTNASLMRTEPVFEKEYIYLHLGEAGSKVPDDQPKTQQSQYHQGDIKLLKMDLQGNLLWETGFEHTGWIGDASKALTLFKEDQLFLPTYFGAALVDKNTGEVIYDKPGHYCSGRMTLEGDYAYMTGWQSLNCVYVPTGEIIWTHDIEFTRNCKPILYGDRVYVVDSDALRVYNKKTGELRGVNYNLGVPGYRSQGVMPYIDDILYILQTEQIVAIRMEGDV